MQESGESVKRGGLRRLASRHVMASGLFLGALLVPLVLQFVRPSQEIAMLEWRTPGYWPDWPRSISEARRAKWAIDLYLQDHLGLRMELIELNSRLRYALGGSGGPEVLVGRDGWLFLARNHDCVPEIRGTAPNLDARSREWADRLAQTQSVCDEIGAPFVYAIAPAKQAIYPEELPTGFAPVDRSLACRVKEELREQGDVHVVDLHAPLLGAKQRRRVYYKQDTHWNLRGAWVAYETLAKAVPSSVGMQMLRESDVVFDKLTRVDGDLARSLGLGRVMREATEGAAVPESRTTTDRHKGRRLEDETLHSVRNRGEGPRAVVLCDSYVFSYLWVFLSESFSEIHYLHHDSGRGEIEIRAHRPDVVICIMGERLL